ncbi:MAG: hypothetical protein J6W52_01270 [Bacteroidaceae bacterium]|nr:hypothetical protein [Bacteroidaceae bacterium]
MKKTYLTWKTIFMVAILSVCFVACSKDDDNDNPGGVSGDPTEIVQQLQGTWNFVKGTETVVNHDFGLEQTIELTPQLLAEWKQSMEQSSGQRIEFWDATLNFNGNTVNGVEYTLEGAKLKFAGEESTEGMDMSVYIKSISSSKLVLHEVFEFDIEGLNMDITADMEYSK